MKLTNNIVDVRYLIQAGGVIAYPTEAVYGVGCSPFDKPAVERIWTIKNRSQEKGFIILIADWTQLTPLIAPISDVQLERVRASWPGPVTWIFPKSNMIPDWLSGQYDGIAIRMSAHPVAHALCQDGPIISTSANISGCDPARDLADLNRQFPQGIDAVLTGKLGGLKQPSMIFDVLSQKRLR